MEICTGFQMCYIFDLQNCFVPQVLVLGYVKVISFFFIHFFTVLLTLLTYYYFLEYWL